VGGDTEKAGELRVRRRGLGIGVGLCCWWALRSPALSTLSTTRGKKKREGGKGGYGKKPATITNADIRDKTTLAVLVHSGKFWQKREKEVEAFADLEAQRGQLRGYTNW